MWINGRRPVRLCRLRPGRRMTVTALDIYIWADDLVDMSNNNNNSSSSNNIFRMKRYDMVWNPSCESITMGRLALVANAMNVASFYW